MEAKVIFLQITISEVRRIAEHPMARPVHNALLANLAIAGLVRALVVVRTVVP
jgi:hypothetical protein